MNATDDCMPKSTRSSTGSSEARARATFRHPAQPKVSRLRRRSDRRYSLVGRITQVHHLCNVPGRTFDTTGSSAGSRQPLCWCPTTQEGQSRCIVRTPPQGTPNRTSLADYNYLAIPTPPGHTHRRRTFVHAQPHTRRRRARPPRP